MRSRLPLHEELRDVDPATICGWLVVHDRLAPADETRRDRQWRRLRLVESAMCWAAAGWTSEPARPPRWLSGVLKAELRRDATDRLILADFGVVRLAERLGLVELPHDDAYVLASMQGWTQQSRPVLELADDDPALLTIVWRYFDHDGGRLHEWPEPLVALVAAGRLDRGRMLERCLTALARDVPPGRAAWLRDLFGRLTPTIEESARLQPRMRTLVGSSLPATVAFALRQLGLLHEAGMLDVAETLPVLPSGALTTTQGAALAAIRLTTALADLDPESARAVGRAGLVHPAETVQRAASRLLYRLAAHDDVWLEAEGLAAPLRAELGLAPVEPVLREPLPVRPVIGVPEVLDDADLAEHVAVLMQDGSDAVELERVLSTLAVRSDHTVLEPLRTTAQHVRFPEKSDVTISALVCLLVASLLGDGLPIDRRRIRSPHVRFVAARMAEIHGPPAPLLATPDLPGGWLSAATLLRRLEEGPGNVRRVDLSAALLRLHPEGRDIDVPAWLHPTIAAALRGELPPSGHDAAWTVAARRSLGPYAPGEGPTVRRELFTLDRGDGRGGTRAVSYAKFTPEVAGAGDAGEDQPTELRQPSPHALLWPARDAAHVLASIWPQDAECFLFHAAHHALQATTSTEQMHDLPLLLEALGRHPGRHGTLSIAVLANCLSASRREWRESAVDAFLDLVPTGAVDPGSLAAELAASAAAWPAQRWAETMRAAAQGPGGGPAVIDVLTGLLPRLPVAHHGLRPLVELLEQEQLRHGRRVVDPMLVLWLQSLEGSSATSRVARRLLG